MDADEKVATTVNQSTTMTCRGRGYPAPTFEWYRDNKIILTGSRYTVDPTIQVGPTEAVGSLSIRDVVAGDFGAYVCIAQNSNGQAHKTVLLTVKSEYHCKSLPLNEGLSLLYLVRVRLDQIPVPDSSVGRASDLRFREPEL